MSSEDTARAEAGADWRTAPGAPPSAGELDREGLRADAAEMQALAAEDRLAAAARRLVATELLLAAAEEALQTAEDRADAAEDRLAQKNLLMSQFEHKLKSSFLVLAGWARMLDESWDGLSEDQRTDGVRTIRARSDVVIAQARALLDEAHAESALAEIEPAEVDLAQLLGHAAVEHASDRHVFKYVGDDAVTVMADPAALQQVLGQLLENAVQYSSPETVVTLAARCTDDDWCEVTVSDEGRGVPAGVDVFAPFVRGTDDVPGSGIGLYIAKKLTDAMGGTITGEANADGPGSTFTVRLPRW